MLPVLASAFSCYMSGFRVQGFRGLGFRGLGFRGLGSRGLGSRGSPTDVGDREPASPLPSPGMWVCMASRQPPGLYTQNPLQSGLHVFSYTATATLAL